MSTDLHARNGRKRAGASRIADVTPHLRRELSEGRTEAHTLAEWLAADERVLISRILPDVGLDDTAARLLAGSMIDGPGVKRKLQAIGAAISEELAQEPDAIVARLAHHPSNYPREWLAFAIGSETGPTLNERLHRIRPLADDRNLNVRESAWLALRPHIAHDIRDSVRLLTPWVRDRSASVRRFAIESTRPRGVWATHIPELKTDPRIGLPLLEPLHSDSSDYVRRAVANWLNDASKTQPHWVDRTCARWLGESHTDETAWTCRHALRTIR